ncbi:MAG: bifunctional acetate--CoA ligase family protein/GNAT family N-acetyltransferase [Candidatus Bathyarchaeia archaeon]
MGIENLNKIFNPQRIAVIGASDREDSLGAKILRNLIGVGYKGTVFPVNPFRQVVQGIMAYPSVSKIPRRVDLAIVATPAHTVPQIVEECGKTGVSGVVITSAGFREAGEDGEALERQILEHKRKYGMRIIGPNSFGIIRPKAGLYATFGDKKARPGKIAFISQSAALCASALDWAQEAQVGFSAVISTGSMIDVDLGDLIDFFGTDAQTRSIVLYVESIKNARNFMSAARGFARTKPIVVVRAGRFKESSVPALSHSGNIAGEDAVYDAAFRRAGIVRVGAISDLFDCAEALAMQPNPTGPNLTIITNAGGPGIMATDSLIAKGGKLSKLSTETVEGLRRVLPSYCSLANPVDIFEEATPERFRVALELCLQDKASNGYLVIYTPQGASEPFAIAKVVVGLAKQTKKPVLVSLMSVDPRCNRAKRFLQSNGVPVFSTPEQAVSTFMYMYSYTQNLGLLYETPEEVPLELTVPASLRAVLKSVYCDGRQVLTLAESLRFLEGYRIPVAKTMVARSGNEAEALASKLGYPVVMKALSPQVSHKSQIEGVVLNVCSSLEVHTFFGELEKRVKKFSATAEFQGVMLQPMIRSRGLELLVGSKKDPQFGSVILFGMGGSAAELYKDVSLGFPPLNQVLARNLIEGTAVYRQASALGVPLNAKALEEVLVKFSQMIVDLPEIKEVDINPLIVDKAGAVAVDARIVLDADRMTHKVVPHEHLVIAPYPQKYVSRWKLKSGVPVVLRPIKPEDEGMFNELFKSLSEETMRFRFFEIIKELPHETLTRYCNLDYDREIAIVAELKENNRQIIGAIRLILEPDGKSGEYAVLVGDKWHGEGLGKKLMETIIGIARGMRLEKVFGFVVANNYKMLRVCERLGFSKEEYDENTLKVTLPLS